MLRIDNAAITLPAFVASNMTDEEMLRAMEDAGLPKYITERFAEMLDFREQVEADDGETERERDSLQETVQTYRDKVAHLRERWDTLADKIDPDCEDESDEVVLMESTVAALEEIIE